MLPALWRAHSARFAVVGLTVTALHLAVFVLVSPWSVPEVANVAAFLTATQVNFALSYLWTWSSRRPVGRETAGHVVRRAVLFNGSALVGFCVNAAVFSTAYRVAGMPPLHSAVVATAASAAANFTLSSRVVFTRRPVRDVADAASPLEAAPADLRTPLPAESATGRGRA
ncbi:GtrA family protein [Geodermatophilus marinus]|uniref:GtrA family protein n=1 Tax=Geodermatophilus sp. LHW52908 TaxID=2303986 RepID=UPI000E3BF40E|nr:GtrA family protein [Geodermatophilus sp. LHW52908]RFU21419.1 GtrA family protein [Geodermatophilus sp. LHW52908]